MINLSQYFTKIKGELYKNTSLALLTWLKVGGPAEYLFIPKNKGDLIAFLKYLKLMNLSMQSVEH